MREGPPASVFVQGETPALWIKTCRQKQDVSLWAALMVSPLLLLISLLLAISQASFK